VDPAYRTFVSYIDKSREFYLARGYGNPYRWACFPTVPFAPLGKPLADCRVGLITTAARSRDDARAKQVFAAASDPPPGALYTDHLAWDKEATHTNDVESFLPIRRLGELGRVGAVSPRFYGIPTQYSQSRTIEQDVPDVVRACREDELDAVLLVAL
jgi:hypothetical protein